MIGGLAGILAGLLGIGGGLVIVPALGLLLVWRGLPPEQAIVIAVASALASMLLTSASAIGFHLRRGAIDQSVIVRLAPAVGLGAIAGAWLATVLPGLWLARVFAIFAGLIGLRLILARPRSQARTPVRLRLWWLAGPLIGGVSAMIGIGGGSFNVPYLMANGYPPVRAVAMASVCGWLIGLGGSLAFGLLPLGSTTLPGMIGHVHWPSALIIGLAGAVAAPAGVALAHRLPAELLGRIFGAVLLLVALRLGW